MYTFRHAVTNIIINYDEEIMIEFHTVLGTTFICLSGFSSDERYYYFFHCISFRLVLLGIFIRLPSELLAPLANESETKAPYCILQLKMIDTGTLHIHTNPFSQRQFTPN